MKQINCLHDLAVNGAPPTFDQMLHVGSPNLLNSQVFIDYVNQALTSRRLTNNGPLVQELEQKLLRDKNNTHFKGFDPIVQHHLKLVIRKTYYSHSPLIALIQMKSFQDK